MPAHETFYEVMRRHGVTRRSFLKFCSLTAAGLGLGPEFAGKIAHALETKPRTPVIWLHGLECTCCTESFIRSGNPLAGDVILEWHQGSANGDAASPYHLAVVEQELALHGPVVLTVRRGLERSRDPSGC